LSYLFNTAFALIFSASALYAQGTQIPFGTQSDTSLPVEVTAETLDVNQENGSAVFSGEVVVVQGEMKLSADKVSVNYDQEQSRIASLNATGNVLLVSGPDAAESDAALYTVDSGLVVLSGNVLMTQGNNAMSAQKANINLVTGNAQMVGRVKTILIPSQNAGDQ